MRYTKLVKEISTNTGIHENDIRIIFKELRKEILRNAVPGDRITLEGIGRIEYRLYSSKVVKANHKHHKQETLLPASVHLFLQFEEGIRNEIKVNTKDAAEKAEREAKEKNTKVPAD